MTEHNQKHPPSQLSDSGKQHGVDSLIHLPNGRVLVLGAPVLRDGYNTVPVANLLRVIEPGGAA